MIRPAALLLPLVLPIGLITTAAANEDHGQAVHPQPQRLHRLLVSIPIGGNSPSMDLLAVASALAARGHRLSVLVPQDDLAFSRRAAGRHFGAAAADRIDWLTFDQPYTTNSDELRAEATAIMNPSGTVARMLRPFLLLRKLSEIWARPCGALMGNATLLQGLSAGGYDAVLTFGMPMDRYDSCGCILAHYLGLPLVTVHGIPFMAAPLDVPQFGSGLKASDLRTWKGAALNAVFYAATRAMRAVLSLTTARALAPLRAAAGLPRGPAWQGRACGPLVQLCANSWALEAPRPLGPPEVLVGAIAPRAATGAPEPPEVAAFVGGASAGAAVVSFGSMPVFGHLLDREDFFALARAFADAAPLRVVWLLRRRNLPEGLAPGDLPLGPNTLVAEWSDINDLLGHPNVRLFISHGGIHSVYEAAFHGVPVVGIPFQFEQAANLRRLQALGMGEVSPEAPALRKKGATFTREGVAALIRKVLSTPSYREAAARAGEDARLLTSYRPPLRTAVEEVEMALVHRDHGRYLTYPRGQAAGSREEPAAGAAAAGARDGEL